MRIESMKYFLTIADYQSMSKAAKFYSIPSQSLSSMMSALEQDLGVKIFKREKRKMLLTEEGRLVYAYCNQFFQAFNHLCSQLHPEVAIQEKERLCVSTQNNIAQTIIPVWLSAIYKGVPNIDIDIQIKDAVEIIDDIENNRSDAGFILLFEKGNEVWPELPEKTVFHRLLVSRPFVWVHKDSILACNKAISAKMLEDCNVIQDQSSDEELYDYIFKKHFHLNLNLIMAANPRIMFQLVKENLAVCPDLKTADGELALANIFNQDPNIIALPFSPKDDYRLITGYIMNEERDVTVNIKRTLELLI
ncbi:MAG: LysR family transcriptional regulator [Peptococcaceae bacterium]|nr:LysR family transcriptional regulator [Peptococcaceae bacterium]